MTDELKKPTEETEVELTQTQEEIEEESTESLEDLKDQLLRALAEVENIRRRAIREQDEARKYAVTGFAREMISVADNFSRALESIAQEDIESQSPAVKSLVEGLRLTEKELAGIFERQGVKKVNPLGEAFNHDFHQAICEIPTQEYEAGVVAQVMQTGYVLHDRLLRPAMVGVARAVQD